MTEQIPNFSNLPNLKILFISGSNLTGLIPNFTLPNLKGLDLSDNQLTGEIPDFADLPKLKELNLSNNQLAGDISNLSNLDHLEEFSFRGNKLTGLLEIIIEKEIYHPGESLKVKLTYAFGKNYDLYAAVLLPNSIDYVTLENLNQFSQLNQPQKWSSSREGKSITLIDSIISEDLPIGEYCIYGILSPENKHALEVEEQWMTGKKCFELLPIS